MAEAEEQPQFHSLAERIAALNRQKSLQNLGAPPADGPRKRLPPPAPPALPARTQTAPVVSQPPPLPRRDTLGVSPGQDGLSKQEADRPVPPLLPARAATAQPSPVLPPRRTSTQPAKALGTRRNSASSEASVRSSVSSLSLGKTPSVTSHGSVAAGPRKLPPICDLASLPPLPPSRRELEAKQADVSLVMKPKLPPRLPSRPASTQGAAPGLRADRILGFNQRPSPRTTTAQHTPRKPEPVDDSDDNALPPVPVGSRPSVAQVHAVSSRPAPQPPAQAECWACRDWSGPDGVAARFPRESLPANDPIGYLARGLCDPFPSYTDKARAIFTWFHHNIAYDTQAFFSGNIGPQTPERTIRGGRAVCAGYAETYKAIAERAGLECAVVCGHGKGFGHSALRRGERPPPPKPDGHAWNAVRIDGGEWKLVDACWGAGHIDTAANVYKQELHAAEFTAANDMFGRKHFPADPSHQLRSDGRVVSWEEYYVGPTGGAGPAVEVYGDARQEGIAEESIRPVERHVSVVAQGGRVRFEFAKVCEHWTSERHGPGPTPLLLLHTSATGLTPMETDGHRHWLDLGREQLGPPGDAVCVARLTSFDGREGAAARGVSRREFEAKRGRVGMGWSYLMKWELVD